MGHEERCALMVLSNESEQTCEEGRDLRTFLGTFEQLPPFPESVPRFQKAFSDPNLSLRSLAGLVEEDPAVAALVLRVAESCHYLTRSHAKTVDQALLRLGLAGAKRTILAALLGPVVASSSGVRGRSFWRHSLGVAFVSEAIASHAGRAELEPATLFLAGLLHDLGARVLALFDTEGFEEVCASAGETSVEDLERHRWGLAHTEVGARLGDAWHLAPEIIAAMAYHHEPWEAPEELRAVAEVVHLADFTTGNLGLLRRGLRMRESFDPGAWTSLGLGVEMLPTIVEETKERAKHSEAFLDLLES